MTAVNAEGAEVNQANRDGIISTESLIFSILNPPSTLFSETNNNSIVLRLEYGDTVFLFSGDAEKEAEASMLANESELWAQILKAGHHGSKTASSIEFLGKVDPDIAIISCGTGNRYGHPHDITLNNLSSLGITIYRTDISGNIIVESDGLTYSVVEGDPFTYIEEKAEVLEDTDVKEEITQEEKPAQVQFVGSKNSDVFHYLTCSYVKKIKEENKIYFSSYDDAVSKGYRPCKVCKPTK